MSSGHEPSFRAMGAMDADLARHLIRLRQLVSETSVLMLISDHGIHYGTFYDGSPSGAQEHRLPLFYLLVPKQVKPRTQASHTSLAHTPRTHALASHFFPHMPHPTASPHVSPALHFPTQILARRPQLAEALSVNQQRLCSAFDVHATLRHLLSYPLPPELPQWTQRAEEFGEDSFYSGVGNTLRPRSLLETIPEGRTCAQAGIPLAECPCDVEVAQMQAQANLDSLNRMGAEEAWVENQRAENGLGDQGEEGWALWR